MGFDISKIGKITRVFHALLDGEKLAIHYRKPDTTEIIGLNVRKERYLKSFDSENEGGPDEENVVNNYGPILEFLHDHVTEIDGLEANGEPVPYEDLTEVQQKGLIKSLGSKQAGEFLTAMTKEDSLKEDEKNV